MPGTTIKNYREFKNLSQKYVADKMGISQNAYSKIENNITQLTVHHIKQLSFIFQVPVVELMKDEFQLNKPQQKLEVDIVDKEEVIEKLNRLQIQLKTKVTSYHQGYLLMASMIKATEDVASSIV